MNLLTSQDSPASPRSAAPAAAARQDDKQISIELAGIYPTGRNGIEGSTSSRGAFLYGDEEEGGLGHPDDHSDGPERGRMAAVTNGVPTSRNGHHHFAVKGSNGTCRHDDGHGHAHGHGHGHGHEEEVGEVDTLQYHGTHGSSAVGDDDTSNIIHAWGGAQQQCNGHGHSRDHDSGLDRDSTNIHHHGHEDHGANAATAHGGGGCDHGRGHGRSMNLWAVFVHAIADAVASGVVCIQGTFSTRGARETTQNWRQLPR